MSRNIEDILKFREDISPFLVHLTRGKNGISAKKNLESILDGMEIKCGESYVSAAAYARCTENNGWLFSYSGSDLTDKQKDCFRAACFSETPLANVHNLLDIKGRRVNLEPYGIVFIKDRLKTKGVSPVMYINNYDKSATALINSLGSLTYSNVEVASRILPLIGLFGHFVNYGNSTDIHDFTWEREWRYPAVLGAFEIEEEDIFIGLCPHAEIAYFEKKYPNISFIDPLRPMEYYATKLILARQKRDIAYSVV